MRKPKQVKITLVYVRWFDSAIVEGPVELDELHGPVEQESAGFLIHEDKVSLTLALDRNAEGKNMRLVLCIPKVNIRRIRRLAV